MKTHSYTFKGWGRAALACMVAGLAGCGGGGGGAEDDSVQSTGTPAVTATDSTNVTGGGTAAVESNYARWSRLGPGTLVRTGDATGFPVQSAYANLWKSGYNWMFTLQSANGMTEALTLTATPAVRVASGDLDNTLTISSMVGGNIGYYAILPGDYSVVHHQFSDNFDYFLEIGSSHYCIWNGVAGPDRVDVSGGRTATGSEATLYCHNKTTNAITSVHKYTYEASLNSDGSLKYASRNTSYDPAGLPTGSYSVITLQIAPDGIMQPVSMERVTVSSTGYTLRLFGYGRVL